MTPSTTTLTWKSNTDIPDNNTPCIVLWTHSDRLHTATWIDGRWVTSAGYFVPMTDVLMYAVQPDVKDLMLKK